MEKDWERITNGMKQEDKSENHIKVPIYYYIDDEGNKVYDIKEMEFEFQMEINKLEQGG